MSNQLAVITEYRCPGETGTVSRSVHLARLAAGYAACAECEYRFDTGSLPQKIQRQLNSPLVPSRKIFTNQGIRGAYLNQITRQSLGQVVEHVLAQLELQRGDTSDLLRVAVGYDARDCSPDIMLGVVEALKCWGCHIMDFGTVSRPAFAFGVHDSRPDAGLYVTGGSGPQHWTGLDLFDPDGHPWTPEGKLHSLAQTLGNSIQRPRRSVGQYRQRYIDAEYAQLIAAAFAPIRQYRIAVAVGCRLTQQLLMEVFKESRCTLHPVTINFASRPESQQSRFSDEIRQRRVDLGVMIEADGLALHLYDETGTRVPHETVEALLNGNYLLAPHNKADSLATSLVTDSQGRYWFQDQIPDCDAILTLAKVLKLVWGTSTPVSQL